MSWHSESSETIFKSLETSPEGLSKKEVNNRLEKYGVNKLPDAKTRSFLLRFMSQFHNVLIYVLVLAGVITAGLGHWIDASVILGVVLINAVIGFIQEGKAENALRAIRQCYHRTRW